MGWDGMGWDRRSVGWGVLVDLGLEVEGIVRVKC